MSCVTRFLVSLAATSAGACPQFVAMGYNLIFGSFFVLFSRLIVLKLHLNGCINNDLVIHKQVKTGDIISRRFGDFMTPLSRLQIE